jgi:hypothetical protein
MPTRIRGSGEVYQPGERTPRIDPWIEKLAWIMDGAIPFGRWSFGLDGIIGLVPGFGDLAGALISMLIVARAVAAGIPRIAVARMVANIAMDTIIGAIPLFGDAFDFAYKSNLKNVKIYRDALYGGRAANARHWWFFAGVLLALLTVGALLALAIIALLRPIVGTRAF